MAAAIVVWYLAVQCVGAVGLLLGSRVCAALPDRGYCASKTLGVVSIGVALWLGAATGLLRNGAAGAVLALLAMATLALAWRGPRRATRGELGGWIREHRALVVAAEIVFALAFLAWCAVRAHDPAADHTEEPMDLMLLVAVSWSDSFPPADPWLAGYPISYYYLGYWLLGTLGHLAGTLPEVTYNLGQATWFALLLLTTFGLAFNLASLASDAPRATPVRVGRVDGTALRAGLLAAVLVGLVANVALPLDWVKRWLAGTAATLWTENWWWWRSSRVVQDVGLDGQPVEVITEFPFFSYLLGDNHPHLLAMPVVLLALTLALALFVGGSAAGRPGPSAVVPGGVPTAILVVAVAGAIAAINTWDVPAVWTILVLATAFAAASSAARPWRAALAAAIGAGIAIVLGTALLYLPYHLTASSQVKGLLPNLFHPTAPAQVLAMFAPLLPGVALLLAVGWRRGVARWSRAAGLWLLLLAGAAAWLVLASALLASGAWWGEWRSSLGGSAGTALTGVALERWLAGWPTLVLGSAAIALVVEALRARLAAGAAAARDGVTFALVLAAAGLTMTLVPELVYLHDSFGTRMNTVFKFWYQGWLLLAIAAALGVTLASRGRGALRAGAVLALLAIAPGFVYPVAALQAKTGGFAAAEPTLDALSWLAVHRPLELEAIRWVRRSTPPDAVVVQRSGGSYRPEHNLVSMATGRPTLLGWGGHEYQWRGAAFGEMSAGREEALGRIYAPATPEDLRATLAQWGVDFVYVGPEERARYEVDGEREALWAETMDLVFENPGVRIYRRRG